MTLLSVSGLERDVLQRVRWHRQPTLTRPGLVTPGAVLDRQRMLTTSGALGVGSSSASWVYTHVTNSRQHAPCLHTRHVTTRAGSGVEQAASPRPPRLQAILFFELEGAVIDMHMDGHREAFNAAFRDMGYDCVQWPMHVYHDLLTVGDGSAEALITNYFSMCGWPTFVATNEQGAFVQQVHAAKQAALVKMLSEGKVPLRTGVKQVIEDAVAAGAEVVFISGTLSEASDLVASNALSQLSPDAARAVRVFSSGAVKQDTRFGGKAEDQEDEEEVAAPRSPGAMLRDRQMSVRQQTAQQFVAGIRAMGGGAMNQINVDPSLLAISSRRVSPDLLAAVAATLSVPLARCAMLAASNSMTEAAASAGIMAVAVPRKMAERGSFNGARAKFSGFGAGDCTWGRLTHFLRLVPATPT